MNGGCSNGIGGSHHGFKDINGPFIIGVAGGTASGKSSVCEKIIQAISESGQERKNIVCVSTDTFYKNVGTAEAALALKGEYNFDHPDALDFELIRETLKKLKEGNIVRVPKYDFKTNSRIEGEFTNISPVDVVLFEGILAFYWEDLRVMYDMKLFVDTDSDTRLARRVRRDIAERGRDLNAILTQYVNSVKPAFEEFCLPTKKFADVIIPRGADNTVAIDLIAQSVKDILVQRKLQKSPDKRDDPQPPPIVKRGSDSKNSRPH